MAEELGERTEKPTARRLQQSRRRGQVAKSQDLSSAIILAAAIILLAIFSGHIGTSLARVLRRGLTGDAYDHPFGPSLVGPAMLQSVYETVWAVAPVISIAFVAAYLSQYIQVGWLLTAKPLEPKLNKLSPIKGAQRIFGLRGLMKTVMNTAKLVAMVTVAWLVIAGELENIAALPRLTAPGAMVLLGRIFLELALWLAAVLLLIAMADFFYQRWQHERDLRMTKQEVKDERKMVEGDPQVKGRRMRMYQQLVQQQIAANVPQADVIVTNPTHFSVAIRYDPETMAAPVVSAKGADELALKIRYLASMNNVPIVQRPPLARALYWGVEVGGPIAPEHYEAIAELLAYVYRIDQRRADRAAPVGAGAE